jgi:type IV secretion system protein VirB1
MGGSMISGAATLAAYLATCAPNVAPSTMTAIVGVESGGNPLALHDNTTRRAYARSNARVALVIARALIARGDSIDVGIAQVNSANFAGYGVDAAQMLEPCANLTVASRILGSAYTAAVAQFPEPRVALWHAISAYNTGSLFAGRAYVAAVVAEATRPTMVPPIGLLTGASIPFTSVTSKPLATAPARGADTPKRALMHRPVASTPFGTLRTAGITRTLSIAINHAKT